MGALVGYSSCITLYAGCFVSTDVDVLVDDDVFDVGLQEKAMIAMMTMMARMMIVYIF